MTDQLSQLITRVKDLERQLSDQDQRAWDMFAAHLNSVTGYSTFEAAQFADSMMIERQKRIDKGKTQ